MGHQKFAVHEVDIGLDAAKPEIEGVEQGPTAQIIVVRMSARQWDRRVLSKGGLEQKPQAQGHD
jgi:hypothetical protein